MEAMNVPRMAKVTIAPKFAKNGFGDKLNPDWVHRSQGIQVSNWKRELSQLGGLDKYLGELASLFFLTKVLTMLKERKLKKKDIIL